MANEATLIARLSRIIPSCLGVRRKSDVLAGIGDDAAVIRPPRGRDWVISTDALVEGAHFLPNLHPAESVGYKALARATSDLAAMGAVPRYFLLTLSLPARKAGAWLDAFARGMARAARQFGMRLVGGDLSRHDAVSVVLTVIGEARHGGALLRSGARPGDALYVSGCLGAAQEGLEWLQREGARILARRSSFAPLRRHLFPEPRLDLGLWLARRKLATAAIDLSDGLSTDLARLCEASGTGAKVEMELLPIATGSTSARAKGRALARALHGGEDYELLFSVPRRLVTRIPARFGSFPLTRIGEITRGRHVVLVDGTGRARPLLPGGWEHFGRARRSR
jgi:thiamine-monophosphate kinase